MIFLMEILKLLLSEQHFLIVALALYIHRKLFLWGPRTFQVDLKLHLPFMLRQPPSVENLTGKQSDTNEPSPSISLTI